MEVDSLDALKLINSKWLDCLEPNLKKGEPDKLLLIIMLFSLENYNNRLTSAHVSIQLAEQLLLVNGMQLVFKSIARASTS